MHLSDVMGLLVNKEAEVLDEDIERLIAERQAARKEKNFKRADEIRDELAAMGIILKDTREGVAMEKGLDFLKETFELEYQDIRTYSPLTLAYIGDAIYELVIRTILVEKGNTQVNKLHKRASRLVKASAHLP